MAVKCQPKQQCQEEQAWSDLPWTYVLLQTNAKIMFTNVKPEKTIYVCSSLYFRDIAFQRYSLCQDGWNGEVHRNVTTGTKQSTCNYDSIIKWNPRIIHRRYYKLSQPRHVSQLPTCQPDQFEWIPVKITSGTAISQLCHLDNAMFPYSVPKLLWTHYRVGHLRFTTTSSRLEDARRPRKVRRN